VPLSAIAKVDVETRPLLINHLAQFPATTVSFNLAPGRLAGRRGERHRERRAGLGLPRSIRTTFQGAALAFRSNLDNELLLLVAAVLVMYIVLGVLYESFIHPITILDAAVRRHRRAAGADAGRRGPHHHRADRHHPAHRHREEERHPHDRLRVVAQRDEGCRRARPSTRPACCASAPF
jgi:hypothetical protein